jgi:hypothetical protein
VLWLSPTSNSSFQWVSTNQGLNGVGILPAGALGSETNGSTLATSLFSATAGDPLSFYFNYTSSDGAGFADYAWAGLFNSSNTLQALLFTARTTPSGNAGCGGNPPRKLRASQTMLGTPCRCIHSSSASETRIDGMPPEPI